MILEIILFIIGIVLLIKGADFLVEGSSSIARRLGVPALMVGLTIVAFGTSMPELIVNILAAFQGATEVAFGNIIGSNIANILLVLGVVAIITPIKVRGSTVWKEIPFSLLAVIVLFIFSNYAFIDGVGTNSLTRVAGLIMICFFVVFIYYTFGMSRKKKSKEKEKISIHEMKIYFAILLILGGLVGLYFGGKWVVDGAIFMARQFGLSEFLISATIIALGTSLPELVTGVTAARKGNIDLAVGNSVGSNIFNIFWVLGITAIIAPILIPSFINVDILFLIFVTFLLFAFLFIGKKREIERWQGIMFILLYIAYLVFVGFRG